MTGVYPSGAPTTYPPAAPRRRKRTYLWLLLVGVLAVAVSSLVAALIASYVVSSAEVSTSERCAEWRVAMARVDERAAARVRAMTDAGSLTPSRAASVLDEELEREFGPDWRAELDWGIQTCMDD